jgi:hypothetical protein
MRFLPVAIITFAGIKKPRQVNSGGSINERSCSDAWFENLGYEGGTAEGAHSIGDAMHDNLAERVYLGVGKM